MGRTMSQEQKDKLAAGRAAAKAAREANGTASATSGTTKRASIAEQLAAVIARADAGDIDAQQLLPAIDAYASAAKRAKTEMRETLKNANRKIRKLLSVLKD
jgi:hypothetical protein